MCTEFIAVVFKPHLTSNTNESNQFEWNRVEMSGAELSWGAELSCVAYLSKKSKVKNVIVTSLAIVLVHWIRDSNFAWNLAKGIQSVWEDGQKFSNNNSYNRNDKVFKSKHSILCPYSRQGLVSSLSSCRYCGKYVFTCICICIYFLRRHNERSQIFYLDARPKKKKLITKS